MIPLISDNLDAIASLCRQYGVRKLAVFGSAVKGTFDPETSDIDLVLDFTDYGPGVSTRFIDFADALEALFGRKVDLVFEDNLIDREFRHEVLTTMDSIYDAEIHKPSAA